MGANASREKQRFTKAHRHQWAEGVWKTTGSADTLTAKSNLNSKCRWTQNFAAIFASVLENQITVATDRLTAQATGKLSDKGGRAQGFPTELKKKIDGQQHWT